MQKSYVFTTKSGKRYALAKFRQRHGFHSLHGTKQPWIITKTGITRMLFEVVL